ncbi:hypothetical protein ACOP1M_00120 [Staphylococcus warneri]|uniref:hypothetical protein n=1 Tax=Staphylococcus warneri TaxID=1292 RepID=UPI003CEEF0F3
MRLEDIDISEMNEEDFMHCVNKMVGALETFLERGENESGFDVSRFLNVNIETEDGIYTMQHLYGDSSSFEKAMFTSDDGETTALQELGAIYNQVMQKNILESIKNQLEGDE